MDNHKPLGKSDLFGAWCCLIYILLVMIGWWPIANYLPPHSPSATAGEIATLYQTESMLGLRLGMWTVMLGAMFYLFFAALVAKLVARVEGQPGVFTYATVMAGLGNAALTFYPPMWWVINAFRPDRAPELIQLLNDAAWLQFVGGLTLFLPILVAIAYAAFNDQSEGPPFSRRVGFFNIWIFVLLLPTQLVFFFQEGPFAWNGVIGFWAPLAVFCLWFVVMFVVCRNAVLDEMRAAH